MSTANQVIIRDGVYDKIQDDQNTYVIPSFNLERSYFPQEELENLKDLPKITVIAMGFGGDRQRAYRSKTPILLDLPVQICLQKHVNAAETDEIDELLLLMEQVLASCEDDELVTGQTYTWANTEPLKDDNGVVYSYEHLRVQGVFQAISILHYQHIKEV